MYRQKHIRTSNLKYDAVLTRKAQAYAEFLVEQMVKKDALYQATDPKNKVDFIGENLFVTYESAKGGLDVFCPKANKVW